MAQQSNVASIISSLFPPMDASASAAIESTRSQERLGLAELRQRAFEADQNYAVASKQVNLANNQMLMNHELSLKKLRIERELAGSQLQTEKLNRDMARSQTLAFEKMVPLELAAKSMGIEDLKSQLELRRAEVKGKEWQLTQTKAMENVLQLQRELQQGEIEGEIKNLPKKQALMTMYMDFAKGNMDYEKDQITSDLFYNKFSQLLGFVQSNNPASAKDTWGKIVELGKQVGVNFDPNADITPTEKNLKSFINIKNGFLEQAQIRKSLLLEQAKQGGTFDPLKYMNDYADFINKGDIIDERKQNAFNNQVIEPVISSIAGQLKLIKKDEGYLQIDEGGNEFPAPLWKTGVLNQIIGMLMDNNKIITTPQDAMQMISNIFTPSELDGEAVLIPQGLTEEQTDIVENWIEAIKDGDSQALNAYLGLLQRAVDLQ